MTSSKTRGDSLSSIPRPTRSRAPAQHVEQALKCEQDQHEQRQSDQSRNAAARQHTVVDLQHEQRSGEAEQADQSACDRNADEGAAMGAERGAQLVRPDSGA